MPEEGRWVTVEEKGDGKDFPLLASEILPELFPPGPFSVLLASAVISLQHVMESSLLV